MSKARYGFIYLLTLRLSTTPPRPLDSYLVCHFGQYSSVTLSFDHRTCNLHSFHSTLRLRSQLVVHRLDQHPVGRVVPHLGVVQLSLPTPSPRPMRPGSRASTFTGRRGGALSRFVRRSPPPRGRDYKGLLRLSLLTSVLPALFLHSGSDKKRAEIRSRINKAAPFFQREIYYRERLRAYVCYTGRFFWILRVQTTLQSARPAQSRITHKESSVDACWRCA